MGPHPMLVAASTMMRNSRISETIAPLCRKKRRRTIWLWLSPATSRCSSDVSSTSTGGSPACWGSRGSWMSVIGSSSLRDPDARIEDGVDEVGGDVGDHREQGDDD